MTVVMDPARPTPALEKPRVRVVEEREHEHGWAYDIQVRCAGGFTNHAVTLCHRDHDYWCGGTDAPSRTVERVVVYLLDAGIAQLPARFDCSTARAWCRQVQKAIDADLRVA